MGDTWKTNQEPEWKTSQIDARPEVPYVGKGQSDLGRRPIAADGKQRLGQMIHPMENTTSSAYE
jgi:hypothetical protein